MDKYQALLKEKMALKRKSLLGLPPGIKSHAWQDYQRIKCQSTNNSQQSSSSVFKQVDPYFLTMCSLERTTIVSDNLPVPLNRIPRSLYVSSKLANKSVEELQEKMLRNELLIDDYDPFIGSVKGQLYYKGVLTAEQSKMMVARGQKRTEMNKKVIQDKLLSKSPTPSPKKAKITQQSPRKLESKEPKQLLEVLVSNHRKREIYVKKHFKILKMKDQNQ